MYRISRLILLAFVGFTEHVGSLVLTNSPMTATDGELFTLICSGNTNGEQDRQWFRDGTLFFTTTRDHQSLSVANPDVYNRYLSGRVSVSSDATQHNVTLRINSAVENGSRWQCVDNLSNQRSNTVMISVNVHQAPSSTHSTSVPTTTTITPSPSTSVSTVPQGDTSMPICTPPMTTTQQCPAGVTSPSGVYIAVGTVGGAVVGSVITVVVVALWMHNKTKNKDAQTPNVYASTSA